MEWGDKDFKMQYSDVAISRLLQKFKPVKRKTMLDHPVIVFDFDGTISEEKYPLCGEPLYGVIDVINILYAAGVGIVIFSCRQHPEHVENAKQFLKEHKIPYHKFNENYPGLTEKFGISSRKLGGDMYFEDKTIEFKATDWYEKLTLITYIFSDYFNEAMTRGKPCTN